MELTMVEIQGTMFYNINGYLISKSSNGFYKTNIEKIRSAYLNKETPALIIFKDSEDETLLRVRLPSVSSKHNQALFNKLFHLIYPTIE